MAGQTTTGTVGLNFQANIAINPSRSELATAKSSLRLPFTDSDKTQNLAHGSAANQINTVWHDRVSTGDTIDLESLTDEFGQAFGFDRINAIFVQNRGAEEIAVRGDVGASRNTPWADDQITIPGGGSGWFCLFAPDATGWTVTTAKKDVEFFTAGSAQNVDVGIMGTATYS